MCIEMNSLRNQVIELVDCLADFDKQKIYQVKVPFIDVVDELICEWFDDIYQPKSEHFSQEFSKIEKEY